MFKKLLVITLLAVIVALSTVDAGSIRGGKNAVVEVRRRNRVVNTFDQRRSSIQTKIHHHRVLQETAEVEDEAVDEAVDQTVVSETISLLQAILSLPVAIFQAAVNIFS